MAKRPERITLLYRTEAGWSPTELLKPRKPERATRLGRRLERRRLRGIEARVAYWRAVRKGHQEANRKHPWGSVLRGRRIRVSALRRALRVLFR